MAAIDDIIERLITDSEFRNSFQRDPASALQGYELSQEDLTLLAGRLASDAGGQAQVEQRTSKAALFAIISDLMSRFDLDSILPYTESDELLGGTGVFDKHKEEVHLESFSWGSQSEQSDDLLGGAGAAEHKDEIQLESFSLGHQGGKSADLLSDDVLIKGESQGDYLKIEHEASHGGTSESGDLLSPAASSEGQWHDAMVIKGNMGMEDKLDSFSTPDPWGSESGEDFTVGGEAGAQVDYFTPKDPSSEAGAVDMFTPRDPSSEAGAQVDYFTPTDPSGEGGSEGGIQESDLQGQAGVRKAGGLSAEASMESDTGIISPTDDVGESAGIIGPPDVHTDAGLVSPSDMPTDTSNPDISNPDISNPDISNPDISNPDVSNPDVSNPDLSNPDQPDDESEVFKIIGGQAKMKNMTSSSGSQIDEPEEGPPIASP